VPNPLDPIFNALAQLRADWPKRGWSWDSRLNCVASSFDSVMVEQAEAAIAKAMPTLWTHRTIAEAPRRIREVGESSGGVRSGQLVYARAEATTVVPYGLWWPWGNESTISLRVGLAADADYNAKLCEIFGTEP
jgi:hypothetical protein